MTFDKAKALYRRVTFSTATNESSFVIQLHHLFPGLLHLRNIIIQRSIQDWCRSDGMKGLYRQSPNNHRVRPIQFSVAFLQNHHPNLLTACRLGEINASILIEGEVVIDYNLLINSIMQDPSHVYSIWVYL